MIEMFVVDTFTDSLFKGNPAAVCIVEKWPTDKHMQDIATENNYSETAFTIKKDDKNYDLRWFTPETEIDLCGHATLATACALFKKSMPKNGNKLTFHTKSGPLEVIKKEDVYEMSFPSYVLEPVPVTNEMTEAFGTRPIEAYLGRDLVAVFSNEDDIKNMEPNIEKVKKLDGLLQNVTALALSKEYDTISRSFAPKLGILEDPVCGSGHCHIIPFWAKKMKKNHLIAFQASKRTGVLYGDYQESITKISGRAIIYSQGTIFLDS